MLSASVLFVSISFFRAESGAFIIVAFSTISAV